jgi:CheY-like chemotaxis protein
MIRDTATEGKRNMRVETEIEAGTTEGARGKPSKIARTNALIVGEQPGTCQTIKEAFGSADIEAVTAKHAEAEELLRGKKFDVILIDVNAPSDDDSNLVRKIRSPGFNQKTLIIMISENQSPGAVASAFGAGASFFVYKPIDKPHLMRLIRATQGSIEHGKRRFRRVAVRTKVRVKHGDKTAEGETIDLSLNGTLVKVSATFPLGSTVDVSFFILPGMVPVVGRGSVMRVMDGNQMGIELERLPVEDSGRLQDYLLPLIVD